VPADGPWLHRHVPRDRRRMLSLVVSYFLLLVGGVICWLLLLLLSIPSYRKNPEAAGPSRPSMYSLFGLCHICIPLL
jgi:hypothetical protein